MILSVQHIIAALIQKLAQMCTATNESKLGSVITQPTGNWQCQVVPDWTLVSQNRQLRNATWIHPHPDRLRTASVCAPPQSKIIQEGEASGGKKAE